MGKPKDYAYFCRMKRFRLILPGLLAMVVCVNAHAQDYMPQRRVLPTEEYRGEQIPVIHLRDVYIYQRPDFRNRRHERYYWRTVRDVKKTLPIAREVRGIIIETYEYIITLPDEASRTAHLEKVEQELLEQYTPRMRKLTFRQGKLLIKLVDRECNLTGYELIRTFMGRFKANLYQTFAALFGASLKKEYDPELEDKEVEEIIYWVEQGVL